MNKIYLIIVLVTIFLSACSDSKGSVTFKDMGKETVEITDSIIVYSSSKDITLWELYAERLKKFPKDNLMYFSDIELKLMNKDGTLAATIFADSAIVNDEMHTVYAQGNIEIYSQEGDIFGETITWDRKKEEIFSEDSVKVIHQGNVIQGTSFKSDSRFEHVTLHRATAEGEVDESEVLW
ncbi:MAG TPA: LPS export ABC transporter periplasmic protein LptC [Candidatus Cloacimonetes bacterium]|nr:LPS export ABC transporter periplasmic protein LptC [Candidatus Cloacimonadota bacterium]HHE40590.1 LPS export ABC transporter periplasmic protein LptC [Candidatus Cloacimonadota bacterium]